MRTKVSIEQCLAEMKGWRLSTRTAKLCSDIRASMYEPKASWDLHKSILTKQTQDEPLIVRNALALKRKLAEVPIGLWDGQLLAGSVMLRDEGLFIGGALPAYSSAEENEAAAREGLSVWSIVGHIVPHYQKLLSLGISGIRRDVERRLAQTSEQGKIDFYRSVAVVLDAFSDFALRYSELCGNLAKTANDSTRKAELETMAANLRNCPENPPESFHQALQAVWLAHAAFQLTGNSLAFGRLDQYTYPYLERDLAGGAIDLEHAQELMDCFFLKCNERSIANEVIRRKTDMVKAQERNEQTWAKRSPFDHSTQRWNIRDSIDATNHWLQNVIIGGIKPADGSDGTNLVTCLALEAFRRNQMTNPCLTVRFHKGSPQALLLKAAEVLETGGGLPAVFNDEAIINSLLKNGFPIEDARDYTNDGCWEVIVAGRTDFYFDRFNMLRCLEWALNRGCSRIDGKSEAPDTGDPRLFSSYDDVLNAFYKMLDYELDGVMSKIRSAFGKRAMIAPTPLLSALLEGPIEKGADMTAGGAKYITYGLIAEGVSHVIDSLASIKKVIFEEHSASMVQLIDALDADFEEAEDLRLLLKKAPKYGNNDTYADDIGQEVINYFYHKVRELSTKYDTITFLPGVGTFSWYIAIGEGVGATPDGRGRSEEVASNFSPSSGCDRKGVTGAIISHAKMQMQNLPVGSPLDLRVAKRLVSGDEGLMRLVGLIRAFVELGGNMLTLTVADTEALREAQREPEKHRNLRVRMGGWSAYFTMLSPEQQEHHIRKQEQL